MSDYISREAAILEVQRYGVGCLDADDFTPEQAERFVISRLESIPAADVRPAEAEWTHLFDPRCSRCGESACAGYDETPWMTRYCPHCGAKMKNPEAYE